MRLIYWPWTISFENINFFCAQIMNAGFFWMSSRVFPIICRKSIMMRRRGRRILILSTLHRLPRCHLNLLFFQYSTSVHSTNRCWWKEAWIRRSRRPDAAWNALNCDNKDGNTQRWHRKWKLINAQNVWWLGWIGQGRSRSVVPKNHCASIMFAASKDQSWDDRRCLLLVLLFYFFATSIVLSVCLHFLILIRFPSRWCSKWE